MKEIGRAPTFELQSCSCLRLQLMNGFLTFWAIFATHQLWEREAGMSKKAALVSAHWCPGQMVPSGTWSATSSSKTLLSEISPKVEPLRLSLETCPILTSVGSPGWQQKTLIKGLDKSIEKCFKTERQVCISATNPCTD